MRKLVLVCDDCHKEINEKDLLVKFISWDLCNFCHFSMVENSIKLRPLGTSVDAVRYIKVKNNLNFDPSKSLELLFDIVNVEEWQHNNKHEINLHLRNNSQKISIY